MGAPYGNRNAAKGGRGGVSVGGHPHLHGLHLLPSSKKAVALSKAIGFREMFSVKDHRVAGMAHTKALAEMKKLGANSSYRMVQEHTAMKNYHNWAVLNHKSQL